MSVSYYSSCQADAHHCPACLNTLTDYKFQSEKSIHSLSNKSTICLEECGHLIHQECIDKWNQHSVKLAERDVRHTHSPTCPLCKTGIGEIDPATRRLWHDFLRMHFNIKENKTKDTAPSLPEQPTTSDQQTLEAVVPLMTDAVNSNNYPAMWQLFSRYGLTLNAEQLSQALRNALPPGRLHIYVNGSCRQKFAVVMKLMEPDEASRKVVSEFLRSFMEQYGDDHNAYLIVKEIVKAGVMGDEFPLDEVFRFYVTKGELDEAMALKQQHEVSLTPAVLKKRLMKAFEDSNRSPKDLLSLSSSDDRTQDALRDVLVSTMSCPLKDDPYNRSYQITFFQDLLEHGVSDQAAVNAAMAQAAAIPEADTLDWAAKLKDEHGAVVGAELLNNTIGMMLKKRELHMLDKILCLFAKNEDVIAARGNILKELANNPNAFFYSYDRAKDQYKELLASDYWDQSAVNTMITAAVENRDMPWANELHNNYKAFLDVKTFERRLSKFIDDINHRNDRSSDYLSTLLRIVNVKDSNVGSAVQRAYDLAITISDPSMQKMVEKQLDDFITSLPGPLS